jgi:hypothetical protein
MALMDPGVWFLLPLVLALPPLFGLLLAPERTIVFVLEAFALLLVALALVAAGGWSWLLRDGLGPDMVISSGGRALARFGEGFVVPLGIASLEGLIIIALSRRRLRSLAAAADREEAESSE